jgi:hypothetical protein
MRIRIQQLILMRIRIHNPDLDQDQSDADPHHLTFFLVMIAVPELDVHQHGGVQLAGL